MKPERDVTPKTTNCQLLSVSEMAKLLRVSPRTVWRLSTMGTIPKPVRLTTKLVRWRKVDLEDYLADVAQITTPQNVER